MMVDNIFVELFQHVALLLAIVFIYDALIDDFSDESPLSRQIISGIVIGFIIMMVMKSSWHVHDGVIMDTRAVILSLSYLFFGPVSACLSAIMAIIFRLYMGGEGAIVGVLFIVFAVCCGALFRKYFVESLAKIKLVELYLLGFVVNSIMLLFFFLMPWDTAFFIFTDVFFPVVVVYPIAQALVGHLLVSRYQRQENSEIMLQDQFLFHSQFTSGGIGLVITDKNLQWVKVNSYFANLLDYTEEEIETTSWRELTHPDDFKKEQELYQQMLDDKIEKYEFDKRMFKKKDEKQERKDKEVSKDVVYVHVAVSCKRRRGEVELIIASILDMTQTKQVEIEIRAKEEQLSLAINASNLGTWDWDIERNHVQYNDKVVLMLNHSIDELEGSAGYWLKDIHPDDLLGLQKAFSDHLSQKSDYIEYEYRILKPDSGEVESIQFNSDHNQHKEQKIKHEADKNFMIKDQPNDGINLVSNDILDDKPHSDEPSKNYHWLLVYGKIAQYDLKNRPIRVCGTLTDITERKQHEVLLSLAASVYNNSNEAMIVIDAEGKIITVNNAFTKLTGYERTEVLEHNIEQFNQDSYDLIQYKDIIKKAIKNQSWQGEMEQNHQNGQRRIFWVSVNNISDNDTEIQRYIILHIDITEKKNAEKTIWQQANYDSLTELPNRRMFLEFLNHQVRKSEQGQTNFALLFLDLDCFKEINDNLGHVQGDQLLIQTAQRLKSCVGDGGIIARPGGDEFTIILTDFKEIKEVDLIAQQILDKISIPFELNLHTIHMSVSIGITIYPNDGVRVDALLKNADQAMYTSKGQGRNCFTYFVPQMQQDALKRMKLINDLRIALEKNQFELYYQPIIEMSTGKVLKAEALIRWHHPTQGLISPALFIPIAEETGLIIEIGHWVFCQATTQIALWRDQFHVDIQISINKSPIQFKEDSNRLNLWLQHLQSLNLEGTSVNIEITEGLLLDANEQVHKQLQNYHQHGFSVSLDDFGTGYSSLAYVKQFDIDVIKIDQSFIRCLNANESDQALCRAIIMLAHKLKMIVVAEGIETAQQKEFLDHLNCDYGQGYLFSKPLPATQFEQVYLTNNVIIDN